MKYVVPPQAAEQLKAIAADLYDLHWARRPTENPVRAFQAVFAVIDRILFRRWSTHT